MNCPGCGCPVDTTRFYISYKPKGYSAERFCDVNCLDDWLGEGAPGQQRDFTEIPEDRKVRLTIGERIARGVARMVGLA